MGIALPAELAGVAGALGVSWPRTDEDALYETALRWAEVAAALRTGAAATSRDLGALAGSYDGLADAVPGQRFRTCALAADTLAGCLLTLAAVLCELKRYVLGRLAELTAVLAAGAGEPDLAAVVLTRAAVNRATRSATTLIDGSLIRLLEAAANLA
jgi:hypothetical protein